MPDDPLPGKPDERGDLYVTVAIELPAKLSEEEKRIVREWQQIRAGTK